ncbi:PPK2 family polyphosphate kinase [Marinicella rhabdoformis]|uniref:PPK2 family polyphosphate kinase n=1 Tax=Marinicella rhabdoformis TaxID=2580566 RepID=UPI0012AED16E|nr:PPK2 family polyphosphate kinase [Marinicella rhabdoformis]
MPNFETFKHHKGQPRPTQKQLDDFIEAHDISLKKQGKRIAKYQEALQAEGKQSLLVIFQAMDAAGKDSTIRNVFNECDPGGLEVAAFKAPSKNELAHDFMWRCYQQFPKNGQITLFNRSYYEEALVVRVHPEYLAGQGIDTKRANDNLFWQHRFDYINQTELHLKNNNTQVIKFMLDVSQEEQHDRFKSRYETEEKRWKFSVGDLKESQHWNAYQNAFDEVLKHTSTDHSPWYVIPADDKPNMRRIVAAITASHLKGMNPEFPEAEKISDKDAHLVETILFD